MVGVANERCCSKILVFWETGRLRGGGGGEGGSQLEVGLYVIKEKLHGRAKIRNLSSG